MPLAEALDGTYGRISLSMYKCPNLRITEDSDIQTPPLTAMRGAGNPQAHWAVGNMMEEEPKI